MSIEVWVSSFFTKRETRGYWGQQDLLPFWLMLSVWSRRSQDGNPNSACRTKPRSILFEGIYDSRVCLWWGSEYQEGWEGRFRLLEVIEKLGKRNMLSRFGGFCQTGIRMIIATGSLSTLPVRGLSAYGSRQRVHFTWLSTIRSLYLWESGFSWMYRLLTHVSWPIVRLCSVQLVCNL